jgi:hypothetical protein
MPKIVSESGVPAYVLQPPSPVETLFELARAIRARESFQVVFVSA